MVGTFEPTARVAQGESGKYYELTPAPWGEINPYGSIGRVHYDRRLRYTRPTSRSTFSKHTDHEDIARVFVIEESWPKKFNLPDSIWERTHDEPKDIVRYYYMRQVISPNGVVLQSNPTWLSHQYILSIGKNPRLKKDMHRSRPFIAVIRATARGRAIPSARLKTRPMMQRSGSTLGD